MNRIHASLARILLCGTLLILGGSLLSAPLTNSAATRTTRPYVQSANLPEKHLFVCVGDESRQRPDFLAVVDFDQSSPNYGKVITSVPFPATDSSGNEPHHVGLSKDGRVLACGGLLSALK